MRNSKNILDTGYNPYAVLSANLWRRAANRQKQISTTVFCRKLLGAHAGGEANTYDIHDLRVAMIEPIPGVFEQLCQNIALL